MYHVAIRSFLYPTSFPLGLWIIFLNKKKIVDFFSHFYGDFSSNYNFMKHEFCISLSSNSLHMKFQFDFYARFMTGQSIYFLICSNIIFHFKQTEQIPNIHAVCKLNIYIYGNKFALQSICSSVLQYFYIKFSSYPCETIKLYFRVNVKAQSTHISSSYWFRLKWCSVWFFVFFCSHTRHDRRAHNISHHYNVKVKFTLDACTVQSTYEHVFMTVYMLLVACSKIKYQFSRNIFIWKFNRQAY